MTKRKWQGAVQESVAAGINLRGTPQQGMSAQQLREADPALAAKWAAFIVTNRDALVKDIAGRMP